ncbi:hypothetical protein Y032_0428g1292 [Ancylostoma ceylanicum]|uniref:Uncharacterized protein n=1 Tax=Ancylostoma ceylanicum TaxID=53326 RepID=A0A016X2D9_9BILA|nr:hypothetical protein Y032_0428g1292 [Ancylostoma ceylanicum]
MLIWKNCMSIKASPRCVLCALKRFESRIFHYIHDDALYFCKFIDSNFCAISFHSVFPYFENVLKDAAQPCRTRWNRCRQPSECYF